MALQLHALRRVPWTCRWGRFGGPVDGPVPPEHGFVFWVCVHPERSQRRLLSRGSCEDCPRWEPARRLEEPGRLRQ